MKNLALYCFLIGVGLFFAGCEKDPNLVTPGILSDLELKVPDHFPDPPIPEENPMTVAKVALGKKIFFDPRLSSDGKISCGSCHLPEKAFSDPRALSLGVEDRLGTRNSPSLVNSVYGKSFFWDGANPSLETQMLFPLTAEFEMNNTTDQALETFRNDPEYVEMFTKAFGEGPTLKGFSHSISAFERSLISANAPYDRYIAGDTDALNASEKRGLTLFNGEKAECFHCHNGHNFTNEDFHNNGIYKDYEDKGRWEATGNHLDIGKFKVPTLRNIVETAPYMHDGSMKTLEEVVDHYASGGKSHPNKDVLIREFLLSPQEKEDLVNFLKALSDKEFLTNPAHRP